MRVIRGLPAAADEPVALTIGIELDHFVRPSAEHHIQTEKQTQPGAKTTRTVSSLNPVKGLLENTFVILPA